MRALTLGALLAIAACGNDGPPLHQSDPDAIVPRTRRITKITKVIGNPPIESIYTPVYDDGGHVTHVTRDDPYVHKDVLLFDYDGDQLTGATDGRDAMFFAWREGRPADLIIDGARFVYSYEEGLLATASFDDVELGRYVYEDGKLVTVDVANGLDVFFGWESERLTSISGGPDAAYGYVGELLVTVQASTETYAITYDQGLVSTVTHTGVGSPVKVTFTYGDGEMVGIRPVPPIPGAAIFGLDGRPLPTIDLLSVELTGRLLAAF